MLTDAPLFSDIADGPDGGRAVWCDTADGVRIRLGLWRPQDNTGESAGTLLLFPGRTEYIEKYGRTVRQFAAAGLTTLVVDWRGQGLADRLIEDKMSGHVLHFDDYQHDVAAMVDAARELDLPKPWFVLGHSMGGGIALKSVMDGLPVAGASFSAPMWGIRISAALRPVAWSLGWSSRSVGFDHVYAPGTSPQSYVLAEPFETNRLTTDVESYRHMIAQVTAHPELTIGGPSLRWLYESLMGTRRMWRRPSPDLPCLCLLGSEEDIVDVSRVHDRMSRWPGGELEIAEGARHEVLQEAPWIRDALIGKLVDFYASVRDRHAPSGADAQAPGSPAPSRRQA
ncbi:alpha/beta hydrolase [Roseovarius atlanticus]|uniref:alpha/beta hydrolase n=1 Tax=Roseovarius atlanticus TaxID=1641875 RepID=UPI0028F720A1|nr:alpha/beta hydrolase [Roseovarius atlanticus]